MLGSGAWRLPSGLPGWLETVLAFALGVTAAGWREMASSTAFVMGVQLWDDVVDFARDRYLTRANLAQRWGRVEAALAGTALLFIALFLAAAKTLLGLWSCRGCSMWRQHRGERSVGEHGRCLVGGDPCLLAATFSGGFCLGTAPGEGGGRTLGSQGSAAGVAPGIAFSRPLPDLPGGSNRGRFSLLAEGGIIA